LEVLQTMLSLKSKKCYGYDNVPLLVLKDGAEVLASPFTELFEKIYQTKQWGIIKCAQEKNITVLMNFLTVLMDL
jgi:hypothetical protein